MDTTEIPAPQTKSPACIAKEIVLRGLDDVIEDGGKYVDFYMDSAELSIAQDRVPDDVQRCVDSIREMIESL